MLHQSNTEQINHCEQRIVKITIYSA